MFESSAARIARHLQPGMRVAVADGAGSPVSLLGDLTEAARTVGGVSLLLGWCLELPEAFDPTAFTDVRTVMGGSALRGAIANGSVRYVPERYSALPSLLTGPLRPDALLVSLAPGSNSWAWGSEVAWMSSVVDAGVQLLVDENEALPRTSQDIGPSFDQGVVVGRSGRPPIAVPSAAVDDVNRRIGRHVAALIPEGATIQYGPGPLADATFDALTVPVRLHSGMLTDVVLSLEERGLLIDPPLSTYVIGSPAMYDWADGRGITTRLEHTHRQSIGGAAPFLAINSALEIDIHGAVNVEGLAGSSVAGIGGHPDFAVAGHVSRAGLSIVAIPTVRRGTNTLVDQLSFPASTPRSDVDIVVTELGVANLRGLDDRERTTELRRIWTPTS